MRAVRVPVQVLYNAWTRQWVLWFNWLDAKAGFSHAYFAVYTAPSPFGPFVLHNMNITSVANPNVGDFAFWQDELTGAAFIIYTGLISINHTVSIEPLTADYLSTLGPEYNSGAIAHGAEAPSLFMHAGRMWASTGHTCCYCKGGSPVTFYSAPHPLGPYTAVREMTAGIPAQQTNILRYIDEEGEEAFLWQGDQWQSAPDRIKGHDFTYTGVISWDSNGLPVPIKYSPYVVIRVNASAPKAEAMRSSISQ